MESSSPESTAHSRDIEKSDSPRRAPPNSSSPPRRRGSSFRLLDSRLRGNDGGEGGLFVSNVASLQRRDGQLAVAPLFRLTPGGLAPRISIQIAQPGERPGRAGHRRGKPRTPRRPGAKLSGSKDPGWPALWKVVRHRRGKPRRGESLRSWTEGRTLAWRAPF